MTFGFFWDLGPVYPLNLPSNNFLNIFASLLPAGTAPFPPSIPPSLLCLLGLLLLSTPLGKLLLGLPGSVQNVTFSMKLPGRYLHFAVSPVFTFHSNLFVPLRWDNTRLGQLSVLLNAWQMINLEPCYRSRESVYVINFLWDALKFRLLLWSMDYYYYKNIEAIIVWICIPITI